MIKLCVEAYGAERTILFASQIFAEPYAHNKVSCRVLEKAGFQSEGLLRQNDSKNSQHMDMKMYAVLKQPIIQLLDKDDIKAAI